MGKSNDQPLPRAVRAWAVRGPGGRNAMSRPFVDMNDRYSYEDWMNDMATNEEACARDSFYNTTSETGPQLAEYQAKAGEQNAKVLRIMHATKRPMTPWEVWEAGCTGSDRDWMIGSVRRSMTVLSAGFNPALVMLDSKRMGPRGRLCYEWCLPEYAEARA